jgi:hypothetical protein
VTLKLTVVMAWLGLFATDYLISFLFITGLALILLLEKQGWLRPLKRKGRRLPEPALYSPPRSIRSGITAAFLAAAFVILIIGYFSGSRFFHFTLSDGRWWRFPLIAASAFPLFAIDELILRPIYPRWKAAALGLLTRALLGASISTGTLVFNREDAFLVLIIHLVVLFWIGLWFATELVHRHTQNAYAAAFFAALIQGWAFAALFITV